MATSLILPLLSLLMLTLLPPCIQIATCCESAGLKCHHQAIKLELEPLLEPLKIGHDVHQSAKLIVQQEKHQEHQSSSPFVLDNNVEKLFEKNFAEESYESYEHLKIYVTTFNANGKVPSSLDGWFPELKPGSTSHNLIVIGIQEIAPLNELGTYNHWDKNEEKWIELIEQHSNHVYVKIRAERQHGIFLAIFGPSGPKYATMAHHVSTGALFGLLLNKGAIGISLDLGQHRLCFVNAHLAARRDGKRLKKRNQEYNIISESMKFEDGRKIRDHDAIIWLGDLNYRLTLKLKKPLKYEEVIEQIKDNELAELFQSYDELQLEQKDGITFKGFKEFRPPPFKPTYKYEPGTSDWEQESGKTEMPAWCDRILYKVQGADVRIIQTVYNSTENVEISDHKPVFAEFLIFTKKEHDKAEPTLL